MCNRKKCGSKLWYIEDIKNNGGNNFFWCSHEIADGFFANGLDDQGIPKVYLNQFVEGDAGDFQEVFTMWAEMVGAA